jgi:iron complex outermembrane receptor protein
VTDRFLESGNTNVEAENVTIRGLPSDFTLVQLNGRTLTSALGPSSQALRRSFDFSILPSEFVSRIEVYKSPTADLQEGGLAGTVIALQPRGRRCGHQWWVSPR